MNICFEAIGLEFEADVSIQEEKACMTGHPDYWKPGFGPEMEFLTLTHKGKDASFLLGSDYKIDITCAAWAAVEEAIEDAKEI
jgi:hypothetical protein